jgi:hypothetical protein
LKRNEGVRDSSSPKKRKEIEVRIIGLCGPLNPEALNLAFACILEPSGSNIAAFF